MNFVEAARHVLEQAEEPLHFREITQRAIDQGLIEVQGNTPWNSMNGTLRRTIRREGAEAEVVAVGEGIFALRDWGFEQEDLGESDDFSAAEMLSGLDYKWRSARTKGMRLFVTPCDQLAKRGIQRSLGLVFMWGISNLLGAGALLFGEHSPVARGLGAQLLQSGLANAVLSWVGSDLLTAEYASQRPVKESTLAAPRTLSESALYVGLLFGGTHLLRGARLTRRSDAQSLKRGRGLGLLLQGGFYLALALMSYVLGQQAESED